MYIITFEMGFPNYENEKSILDVIINIFISTS